MRVHVISDTIQEFDGVRYYLCGSYFQNDGVRLHRTVWAYHNGPIPNGHHVHHEKEDTSKNQIEDLELKEGTIHNREHSIERGMPAHVTAMGIEAAKEWHASAEGSAWHADHYEKNIRSKLLKPITLICEQCESSYQTTAHKRSTSRFCGGTCRQRARRALQTGVTFD